MYCLISKSEAEFFVSNVDCADIFIDAPILNYFHRQL